MQLPCRLVLALAVLAVVVAARAVVLWPALASRITRANYALIPASLGRGWRKRPWRRKPSGPPPRVDTNEQPIRRSTLPVLHGADAAVAPTAAVGKLAQSANSSNRLNAMSTRVLVTFGAS
jgi:hypothetical protein